MENKIIITVGRQIGSGGLRIARMVAEKLGIATGIASIAIVLFIDMIFIITLVIYVKRHPSGMSISQ